MTHYEFSAEHIDRNRELMPQLLRERGFTPVTLDEIPVPDELLSQGRQSLERLVPLCLRGGRVVLPRNGLVLSGTYDIACTPGRIIYGRCGEIDQAVNELLGIKSLSNLLRLHCPDPGADAAYTLLLENAIRNA